MPGEQDFIATIKAAIKAQVPQATFPDTLPSPFPAGATHWMQGCQGKDAQDEGARLAHNVKQVALGHNSANVHVMLSQEVDPTTGAERYKLEALMW